MTSRKVMAVLGVVLMLTVWCYAVAYAQTWYPTNQATVAWDAVASVATGDVIKYQVYTKVGATGTPTKVGGEITATQLAVTFNIEGRYFVGVEAIRYPVGETVGTKSTTSWSNVAADCAAAGPFGIVYYVSPLAPKNLRDVR